jgi:hypothetical protein
MSVIVPEDRVEQALAWGDLSRLTKAELFEVKKRLAERMGVDLSLTPIDLIPTREGKLIPYINARGAAELRRRHGLEVVAIEVVKERIGLVVLRCVLRGQDGRMDQAFGAAEWREDRPSDEARSWMVAETRAKRRATMSAVGIFLEGPSEEVEGEVA